MPASELIVLMTLCAGLGTAAVIDMRQRRIPNAVCVATAVAGLALASTGISNVSVASALAGLALGLVMMLPGHVLGATGAGDVKLFAAAGTLLGGGRMTSAFFFVALAGGVLALAIACYRGRLVKTMLMTVQLAVRRGAKREVMAPAEHNRFSFGPAIAVGCVIAMLNT